jgi:ATP-dependent RNA helicase SUPV3L1/SUV3
MTSIDPARLATTHPELFEAPFAGRAPFRTLSDLGLRFADDARARGYVQVRPAVSAKGRTVAALWLDPGEWPSVEALLPELEAFRERREAARAEHESLKREKRAQARRSFVLSRLALLSQRPEDEVEARLGAAVVDELAASALAPEEALLRTSGAQFRGQPPHPSEPMFHAGAAVLPATGARHVAALIDGGPAALADVLELDLAALQDAAREIAARWAPTRPPWFEPEALEAWALSVASTGRNDRHPIYHYGAARELLSEDPVVGTTQFHSAEARLKAPVDQVLQLLWSTPYVDRQNLKRAIRAAIAEVARRPLAEAAEAFVDQHPHADVDPGLEYTAEEWREACFRAYVTSIDWKWKPHKTAQRAESRLAEELSLRGLELTARRARRELPEKLKDFYPLARSLGRRITFLGGTTNSGKTHRALEMLKAAPTGAYLGPLRLLALEVYERLNDDRVPTSLVTGELIEEVEGARHVAATVEMLNVGQVVDVAVIDEIQMIADPDRGTAWLHAMLGAPARHLVLVGSPSALPAVRTLAAVTGEPLEEIALERLNPLEVLRRPTRLADLEPGTALIVFSRQAALSLAQHLREAHRRSVSVIYGALSPEVRREQARQFREGETEIVVATDAIGMGLNLPIRTLLFTTHVKWNGESEEPVSRSLTWQIAGRAGRYGLHEAGFVGALDEDTLDHVREMLGSAPEDVEFPLAYGLTLPVAEAISRQLDTTELALVLQFFATRLTLEDWAVPQAARDEAELASYLGGSGLPLDVQLTLSHAPATQRDEINPWFGQMVRALIDHDPGQVRLLDAPAPANELEALEQRVRDLTLYSWMHYRWPTLFPGIDDAQGKLAWLNSRIIRELQRHPGRRCSSCERPMPWDSPHGRCEQCFRGRRPPGRSRAYG